MVLENSPLSFSASVSSIILFSPAKVVPAFLNSMCRILLSGSPEEAAYRVGFTNYSNFFRLYKKYMGLTPLEFKQHAYSTRDPRAQ